MSKSEYKVEFMRDLFAASAMEGLLSEHGSEIERSYYQNNDKLVLDRLARFAYLMADAMLEARDE